MIFVAVSTGHFDPLIAECEKLKDKFQFFGQIGMGTVIPSFPHVKTCTPAELEEKMQRAKLVITHGGTGMLSTLYRLRRPSIVIPKQIRYGEANDGQVELAKKWGELGLGVLCLDVTHLEETIVKCESFRFEFRDFPPLGEHIRNQLGWDRATAA